jgi:hypothetical protein
MIWTTVKFEQILESYLPQYLDSVGEDRKEVIRKARNEIKAHGVKSGESVPEDLKKVRITQFKLFKSTDSLIF